MGIPGLLSHYQGVPWSGWRSDVPYCPVTTSGVVSSRVSDKVDMVFLSGVCKMSADYLFLFYQLMLC